MSATQFTTQCVAGLTGDSQFLSAWTNTNFCPNYILTNLQNNNLDIAQQSMVQVFDQYFTNGLLPFPNGGPGTFQNYLYENICSLNQGTNPSTTLPDPAACSLALTSLCSNYQRSDAVSDQNISNFCGCYLPSQAYSQYENQFGIAQQCDPICRPTSTIPLVNSTGQIQSCTSNICIIDDVTITIANSTVGSVTFSDICGGCAGAANCQCYINGVSINTAESSLSNINLNQNCTGAINCYTGASGTTPVQVPCASTNLPTTPTSFLTTNEIIVFAVSLIILVIVIIVIAILYKK